MLVYTLHGDRLEAWFIAQQRAGEPCLILGNHGQPGSIQTKVKVGRGLPHPKIVRADVIEKGKGELVLVPEVVTKGVTEVMVCVRVNPGDGGHLHWSESGEILATGVRSDGVGRVWDERLYLLQDGERLEVWRSGDNLVGHDPWIEVVNERGELVLVD